MPPSPIQTPARRSLLLLGGLAAGGMLAGCAAIQQQNRESTEEPSSEPSPEPERDMPKKPVLYLYPTKTMGLSVSLDYEGTLTYTYPTPQTQADGSVAWQVTAAPDGDLTDASGIVDAVPGADLEAATAAIKAGSKDVLPRELFNIDSGAAFDITDLDVVSAGLSTGPGFLLRRLVPGDNDEQKPFYVPVSWLPAAPDSRELRTDDVAWFDEGDYKKQEGRYIMRAVRMGEKPG